MRYVKFWRLVRGKTQIEMARSIGTSQGYYCDIEKWGRIPGPEIYSRIADAIDRPVEEVVGKMNDVDPKQMGVSISVTPGKVL